MYKAIFLPILLLCSVASTKPAASWDGHDGHDPRHGCISDEDAFKLAEIWENFYVNFDPALADKYLADDLHVISDSIRFVFGDSQVDVPIVTSKADFTTQQTGVANAATFTTTNVWHGCNDVTLRWRWNIHLTPSYGIDVLELQPGTHLIYRDYSENNMIAVLNNGGCKTTCPDTFGKTCCS